LRDKPIRLIKWQKTGLGNLLGSPYIKRRIRGRAIRDYRRGEHKTTSYPFNVAPTTLRWEVDVGVDDYRNKEQRQSQMTLPLFFIVFSSYFLSCFSTSSLSGFP
jgi:hypothetical protein